MLTYDLTKTHQAQLLREAEQAYLFEAVTKKNFVERDCQQRGGRALVVLTNKTEMLETRKAQNERHSRY